MGNTQSMNGLLWSFVAFGLLYGLSNLVLGNQMLMIVAGFYVAVAYGAAGIFQRQQAKKGLESLSSSQKALALTTAAVAIASLLRVTYVVLYSVATSSYYFASLVLAILPAKAVDLSRA